MRDSYPHGEPVRINFSIKRYGAHHSLPAAVDRVAQVANHIGFDAVVVGPLRLARYLEAIAHLNIAIALGMGGGTQAAFKFDRGAAL